MKTTRNNNRKTENSSVKRMTVRATAVVFSLIIISLTSTSAQELLKQLFAEGNYGKMVELKTRETEFKETDAVVEAILTEADAKLNHSSEAYTIEAESDKELAIEPWMTDANVFSANAFTVTEEKDPELNVEGWMTNNSNFSNTESLFKTEAEPALEVEPWMTDSNNFKVAAERTDKDPELNVENWMLDNQYFTNTEEKPLQLEAWMTDNNLWGF